jgi:hypothetical protein
MDKRAEYEAYERRQEEDETEGEEEEAEDEDEEAEEEGDEEAVVDEEEDEEVAAPKKKKPAKEPKPKAKAKAKPRTRAPKAAPRMKVVWGVFNNSNQRVATFDYPKKHEAEAHAAKLKADKNQTFFVQPVKEPMEEKKDKD